MVLPDCENFDGCFSSFSIIYIVISSIDVAIYLLALSRRCQFILSALVNCIDGHASLYVNKGLLIHFHSMLTLQQSGIS